MVGRLLVGFVWLNLQFSVSWQVDFQLGSCGSIFSFLCHGRQTFSGVRVAQSLAFCVMVGKCLVGFVWLNRQFFVSWQVDFQWASCVSIFRFRCHGGRLLVGSCGSNFSFLCHGWQTFSGVRVAQSLVFCVLVGRLLVGSCGSNFSFLCHGWQTFSGVRGAQSLVFCVMFGRLLVGFVWLNLQFSVSWLVDFQWGSCGSIFSFLCHGRQTFSGVRVAQSLAFCVMVGRLLVGFVWLNLQFFVSWQVDFQRASCVSIFSFRCHGGRLLVGSCGSIFSFLCHGWQTFSGVRVAQSLVFCVMVGRLLVVSCGSNFSFLCHGWQTFSGVRVAQSLVFSDLVGRLLVSFVWLNLLFFVSWLVDFQWGSCGSIFSFLCHGWQTFSGVRVAQSLVFCVMVGRLLVGFVWLNLQLSVSWLVDFQWGSCGSIFSFLCHGRQTFRGLRVSQSLVFGVMVVDFQWVRVAQTLVFCVLVGRLLVGFVWLNLQFSVSWLVDFQWFRVAQTLVFCVMVGRLLVGFVWLNLQFSLSWLVDFQWSSCGSIFSFLCHGWQTFSGVRVAQSLVFCVMVGRLLVGFVWLNLYVFCVMVGRLLVGSVWLNLQFSVSWLVDFQWGSCGSIFMFSVSWLVNFQWGPCGSIFSFLCHGWQTFSRVRVAQSLVFCVMVGRLLVGFVWLNLQFSVSWQIDFQWGSCGSIFSFLCHGWQTFSGVRVAQSLCFLCHGWQTFSGVRVAQSLVFCVMVGRLLVGFVWLNLQFSVPWQVDFQWGSCGSIFSFLCHGLQTFSGVRVAQSLCFLCHGWQTFSWVRVAQSLVFRVMVGRLLVGFVWLNLYVFCVMVGRLLVGSVWLNLQFSVSWLVDFQWGSCGSIFSFLCHGRQTFSGVRVAQSLVFCVMVGRLLVGFVWLNLYVFCVMVGRLLVGSVWLNLQFSVSWLVDFQCGSCGSIFSFLRHGRQTFSGVRVAQSLVFCVMVGRLLVGFVWLNLQLSGS